MSAIDNVLQWNKHDAIENETKFAEDEVDKAIADLAYLRAAADERDYLQRRVDSLQLTLETINKHNDELQARVEQLSKDSDELYDIKLELGIPNRDDVPNPEYIDRRCFSTIDKVQELISDSQHLDALCSELAAATGHEYTPDANFDAHEAISQLVERIAQARELLTTLEWNDWDERVDAWLSANAPTPQEERTA